MTSKDIEARKQVLVNKLGFLSHRYATKLVNMSRAELIDIWKTIGELILMTNERSDAPNQSVSADKDATAVYNEVNANHATLSDDEILAFAKKIYTNRWPDHVFERDPQH